jgi:hypothetical protein
MKFNAITCQHIKLPVAYNGFDSSMCVGVYWELRSSKINQHNLNLIAQIYIQHHNYQHHRFMNEQNYFPITLYQKETFALFTSDISKKHVSNKTAYRCSFEY